jgi:two-component system, response regulator, stage 0 sporulation protein F
VTLCSGLRISSLPSLGTIDLLARHDGEHPHWAMEFHFHRITGVFLGMATILIIDDEEIIRVLLRSALEAAGYEITEDANGRQGLKLYRHGRLVITDIVMPELNGLDMPLELAYEFLDTKVIALSGARGEKNILDVAKLLGARQTFQKPFSMPHLLGAVRYELEH